jgi:hypothetical protein
LTLILSCTGGCGSNDPRHACDRLPSEVLQRVKPKIEQGLGVDVQAYMGKCVDPDKYTANNSPIKYDDIIPLKDKPSYFIVWSGEAEYSGNAIAQLGKSIPVYFGMMILVVIFY